jgi:hypothetical protein
MDNEPTNCQQCNAPLTNGYCYTYKGTELIGAHCFDCDRLNIIQKYKETKVLSTRLLTNNILDLFDIGRPWSYHEGDLYTYKNKTFREIIEFGTVKELEEVQLLLEIRISFQKIYVKMKEFEQKVWFKGLQETINASKCKGVSAILDEFKVLTYTMCGRTIITIEDKKSSVSMICANDSAKSTMGDKGIDSTEEQAIKLIDLAIELYESGHLKFKDDNEVSYL